MDNALECVFLEMAFFVKVLVIPNLSVLHHTRNRTKTNTSHNSFIVVSKNCYNITDIT